MSVTWTCCCNFIPPGTSCFTVQRWTDNRRQPPLDAPGSPRHFYPAMATHLVIDHRAGALRHPEKAHRPDNPIQRKPAWIRVKAPNHPIYHETRTLMRDNGLVTVWEEAAWP